MFNDKIYNKETERELLTRIKAGDKAALSQLVEMHYAYIYNVALKFFNGVPDAEDATQEVIIKFITNIGSYDASKGQLRTWLYRIVFNHFLNAKKSGRENLLVDGFHTFFSIIETIPDTALSNEEEEYMKDSIEEVKTACMAGMLLCLSREQRLVYIVGELFDIDHNLASEIFEISPANFRKRLSRARKELYNWMTNKCGLVNKNNPCRCPKKTKGFIEKGFVNPDEKMWNTDFYRRIYELSENRKDDMLIETDKIYAQLYREHPFKNTKEKSEQIMKTILSNDDFSKTFNLN